MRWPRKGGRRARIYPGGGERPGLARLPDGGVAAALAIAQNSVIGGNDVGFDTVIVNALPRLTHIADQSENSEFLFLRRWWRELHLPEIQNGIEKRDAVCVNARVFSDLADHADFRLFVAFRPAQNHFLFGRKLVPREKACAVEAEENSLGFLRKNPARQIGTDQDDGNLFRHASASAHNLLWQAAGQNGGSADKI